MASTKYGTNISMTDHESHLPEGVQQLKIPNYGSEQHGSSVQENINEAKKINHIIPSYGFQSPNILTERQHHRNATQPDEITSLGFDVRAA